MSADTITEVLFGHGRSHPDLPVLRFHRNGRWQDMPWGLVAERVRAIAGGLAAAGVAVGDRVAIVSRNRPEWALADLGSLAAGAVVATVYPTLPPDETAFILGHCAARAVFVEDAEQLDKIVSVRDRLPRLETVVVLDGSAAMPGGALPLAALEGAASPEDAAERVRLACALGRDAPMTVVYTSGTTGVPKGAVLTHGNVLGVIESVLEALGDASRLRLNLSFLPLAHALERIAGHYMPVYLGKTIAYARSLDTVAEDFQAIRPDFAVAVPRVFEKVSARIIGEVARKPPPVRALFAWALAVGTRRSELEERGAPIPAPLRARHLLADALVLRKVRARFGGRLKLFVSGGAPLAADVARMFHACGILVCEGWGATETAAPATWNTPRAFRFGSVGRPLPRVDVRIAADGELEVRGPNVFLEYLDNPQDTADAFTADGFWRSGDIGSLDEDGFFHITDRKKELVILASGKNIAPAKIENLLRQQTLVSNCMVHGDRRPYLVALITVDRAALSTHRPELATAEVTDSRLREAVAAQLEAVNSRLARFEQVKRFALVEPDFTPEGGELTLTLKLKRRVILERHRKGLDALYEAP